MIITCRGPVPATDAQLAANVSDVLRRRAAVPNPPLSLVVTDAVALGIAHQFHGPTPAGRLMERFRRGDAVESDDLIEAAEQEKSFTTPEGYAALHCLITWVHGRVQRSSSLSSSLV